MKNKAAVALGRMKTEKKAKAARINGAKGGRPPKIHTLKKPCTFPDCKVTVGHEHQTGETLTGEHFVPTN